MAEGRKIDPITLEVVHNGMDSLVDEMALTVMRTAYSGVVKDALDYSTAFCDRKGEMIAQGLTIVAHLGSFPSAVNSISTFEKAISGDIKRLRAGIGQLQTAALSLQGTIASAKDDAILLKR